MALFLEIQKIVRYFSCLSLSLFYGQKSFIKYHSQFLIDVIRFEFGKSLLRLEIKLVNSPYILFGMTYCQASRISPGVAWFRKSFWVAPLRGTRCRGTISDKIFGTNERNPVKLNNARKVCFLLLRVFFLGERLGTRLCLHPSLRFF